MGNRVRWETDNSTVDSRDSTTRHSYDYDRSSYGSHRSYSTAQTAYSDSRPLSKRADTCLGRVESYGDAYADYFDKRRASVDTYASTEQSEADIDEAEDEPDYDFFDSDDDLCRSDAIPATPRDFSDLFPSSRRLSIHHDDSTLDGNMNLRVDTQVETDWSAQKQKLTLFHLKMNDLNSRSFSLRRYCRDSGREVCNSIRKYHSPALRTRSTLTKSFNSALATLKKHHNDQDASSYLRRNDSGYGSFIHGDLDEDSISTHRPPTRTSMIPTNTIQLEFSNYAHVDVKRRGIDSSKCYNFEYWGHRYSWKRTVGHRCGLQEVSFHLVRDDKDLALAHIVPVSLSRHQAADEQAKGGWIAPCSMWITDEEVFGGSPDIADLIVASGLVALVDDSIKRKWHSKTHKEVSIPFIGSKNKRMGMELIGPKRLIDEVFNRRPSPATIKVQ